MTMKQIEAKYGVNVMRVGATLKKKRYVAFRGGAGTGKPIINVAESYTLATLCVRIERALTPGKPLIEIL